MASNKSKTYLQVIAQQIKSIASPLHLSGPEIKSNSVGSKLDLHTPTTVQPNTNLTGHTNTSVPNNPHAVQEMQQQLLGLAKDATTPLEIGAQNQPVADPVQSFISEHYLKNSEDPGAQGVPIVPNQPVKNNVVSDALEHILAIKNFADGAWGPITNTALKNAYAFAVAIFDMAEDFKIPIAYTDKDLQSFHDSIPNQLNDFSPEQKQLGAESNTIQLKLVRQMYAAVKNGIRPHDRAMMQDQTKVLQTYQKPSTGWDQQTLQGLSQMFDSRLNVALKDHEGRLVELPITINDLLTPETLNRWKAAHAPNTPIQSIMQSIKSTVNAIGAT